MWSGARRKKLLLHLLHLLHHQGGMRLNLDLKLCEIVSIDSSEVVVVPRTALQPPAIASRTKPSGDNSAQVRTGKPASSGPHARYAALPGLEQTKPSTSPGSLAPSLSRPSSAARSANVKTFVPNIAAARAAAEEEQKANIKPDATGNSGVFFSVTPGSAFHAFCGIHFAICSFVALLDYMSDRCSAQTHQHPMAENSHFCSAEACAYRIIH